MVGLPEKIRRTLEKQVAELQIRETVYGVGLFGSWSRGDAAASSDIDLLILDKGDFAYEYVERLEVNGLFIDLNHIPKRWLSGLIPPEVDQKLYEMQILYDRDWSLNNARLLMAKSYGSPERVGIRTEAHVVNADIYLSRATSAFSRDDFKSAYLFATVALEIILRVLFEIALEPFAVSRFVEKLEVVLAKVGKAELFNDFLEMTKLNRVNDDVAREKLRLFKLIWDEMKVAVKQNVRVFESLHFKVRTNLDYYLNQAFLQGFVLRAESLIVSGKVSEACHYLNSVFLDVFESYMWLAAAVAKVRIDYSTLMRSLEVLERRHAKNYDGVVRFLGLDDKDKFEAAEVIDRTKRIVLELRKERVSTKNHLLRR